MFTGIVKSVGRVKNILIKGTNKVFDIEASFSENLTIDESVSHNGVCLTVVAKDINSFTVEAIKETLEKSNLGQLAVGDNINLERAMVLGSRLDGHMVQGHVDTTIKCVGIEDQSGSHLVWFNLPKENEQLVVDKGSICINGVSLTIAKLEEQKFAVAIIPYTWEHTSFNALLVGTAVNIEFDIVGKYVQRMLQK